MRPFINNSYFIFRRHPRSAQSNTTPVQSRNPVLLLSAILSILLATSCLSGCVGLANATAAKPENTTASPSIAAQPISQDVSVGQSATFTVAATGTSPFSYQWTKNGNTIGGGTSAAYST